MVAQYQSFPGASGDSRTLEKLKALQLPAVKGRSFLDVGCNEGFFCGFARHLGAKRVVGVDSSAGFVARARQRFPDCEFLCQDWKALPEGPFDVILLASALHYADNQLALIEQLVQRLGSGGVLVVELGIVSSAKAEWVKVKRGSDERYFPSMPQLQASLADYAWKWMGPSVNQSGDPVSRHVIHVSRRQPVAYLLMQPPAFGKSSLARRLFVPAGVPVVSGDEVLRGIAQDEVEVSAAMRKLVAPGYSPLQADETLARVFAKGLGPQLVRAWLSRAPAGDVAVDGFVPEANHAEVKREFTAAGYLPVTLSWERATHSPMPRQSVARQADAFYRSIGKSLPPAAAADPTRKPVGYVDALEITANGIALRGWALDETGAFPSELVIGIGPERTIVATGSPIERSDVQRHLEWEHSRLGYLIKLPVPAIATAADLGRAGFSVSLISGMPLRLAPGVQKALAGAAE